MTYLTRGSLWNRWDFHVHTPFSTVQKYGDPGNPDIWAQYVQHLCVAVEKHSISAIVFQDYFSCAAYFYLIEHEFYDPERCLLRSRDAHGNVIKDVSIFLLPGMELRVHNFTHKSKSINLHLIFDPSLSSEVIQASFLSQVPIYGEKTQNLLPQSIAGYCYQQAKTDNESKYSASFGKASHDLKWAAQRDYLLTSTTVELDKVLDALASMDKASGVRQSLVMLSVSGHGSVSGLDWKGQQGQIRKYFTRSADILLSSSDKDRRFYLGQTKDVPEAELRKHIGGIKPCIWGSDSHDYPALLAPSGGATDKFTYIKADLTFLGLKQILPECESRVFIGFSPPEAKSQYAVISDVEIQERDTKKVIVNIPLNSGLIALIGGKSTGKSLLLTSIARAVDRRQTHDKLDNDTQERFATYWDKYCTYVRWQDDSLSTYCKHDKSIARHITFIPQLYITSLAEESSRLTSFVIDVLDEQEDFRSIRRAHLDNMERTQNQLSKARNELEKRLQRCIDDRSQIGKLGNIDLITAELKRLKKLRTSLQKKGGFSKKDQTTYNKLNEEFSSLSDAYDHGESYLSELTYAGTKRRPTGSIP
jgi:hypothetical protein